MTDRLFKQYPWLKDTLGLVVFAICVLIGTLIINSFVFRSFTVEGRSMQKTLYEGDRLIIDRLPVTAADIQGKQYVPARGQIIVFKNPHFDPDAADEYIVKRVIAFPGERVVLKDGAYTVYNSDHPNGFNPDDANHGEPATPTTGLVDVVVPSGSLFVSGDHRDGANSLDSRNGLGYIPYEDVIGPVSIRIFPFNKMRVF